MTRDPCDTLPAVAWGVLAGDLVDAGSIAERIMNASSDDVADLIVAARHKTLARTCNMLTEAAENALALARLLTHAEERLLAAHEAQRVAEEGP